MQCIISIAYDTVVASPRPELWRLPEVFLVSTLLGLVAVASSIFLLYCGLSANQPGSYFEQYGIVSLPTDGTYGTRSYEWQAHGQSVRATAAFMVLHAAHTPAINEACTR